MDYTKYALNEEHRRMFQLMGLNENVISEQDEKDKIKELKDALKRERENKRDTKKLNRQEKRAERKRLRQRKKELKMFEKLCAKFPDAPECADKDEMIKTTEEDIKQVEVDTQDVGDDVGGEEQTKEKICNLPGDKKYEYKVEDDMWFAREKGTEKWISLAADNMKKARCRLDKGCKGFRTKTEQNCEATKQKPEPGDKLGDDAAGEQESSSATQTHDPDSWKKNIPGSDPESAKELAKHFAYKMGYGGYTGN